MSTALCECMKITKLEAAKKQLDYAINAYFHGVNLIVLFPIAGAAHVLTHDLVEAFEKRNSWVSITNLGNLTKIKEKLFKLRASYNWLKHADNDFQSEISLSSIELEHLLMTSILDLVELTKSSDYYSETTYAFYLWFIAKNVSEFRTLCDPGLIEQANVCFPNLCNLPYETQISEGLVYLTKKLNKS